MEKQYIESMVKYLRPIKATEEEKKLLKGWLLATALHNLSFNPLADVGDCDIFLSVAYELVFDDETINTASFAILNLADHWGNDLADIAIACLLDEITEENITNLLKEIDEEAEKKFFEVLGRKPKNFTLNEKLRWVEVVE